jgi:hypothetical protein
MFVQVRQTHYGGYPPFGGTAHCRAVRQRAIEARLEVEDQAFERHIFRYLFHVAGLETSRDLWNELGEWYRRMELATFCELFANFARQLASAAAVRVNSLIVYGCSYIDWMPSRPRAPKGINECEYRAYSYSHPANMNK